MFGKMKRAELGEECEKRGIEWNGLTRKGMIERLEDYEKAEESGEGTENEDTGGDESGRDQLKLELIRAEKEKIQAERERMEMEMALNQQRAQLGLLQTAASVPVTDLPNSVNFSKLPSMGDGEDLASYFHSFEKVASLQGIDESKWARILPSLLNPAIRLHYNRLKTETCADYKETKIALLSACRMNAKFYLEKFKAMRRVGKQSYSQLLDQLRDVFGYYLECREIDTLDSLVDDILMERIRETLPADAKYFVEARRPQNAAELANFADIQYDCASEARKLAQNDHKQGHKFRPHNADTRDSQWGGKAPFTREPIWNRHHERNQDARPMHSGFHGSQQAGNHPHTRNTNRFNSHVHAQVRFVKPKSNHEKVIDYQQQFIVPMYVNGKLVQSLRDSGSHVTLIDSELARDNPSATCEPMTIQCAFGNVKCVKTCEIEIWSPKFGTDRKIKIKAGVIPRLGIEMIIGHDLFVSNKDLKDPVAANNGSRQDDSLSPHPMTLIATRRRDYDEADRLRKAVGLQEDKTDSARTELCPSGDNYERRDECQDSTTNDESPSSKDETGARPNDVQVYDRNRR